ncbi:MAG TPA: hypothetical protein VNV42_13180 [Solirubrobacteraceae bacterium]|jgi:hypothetical protein|nr:hypothetical protein [Solirubrobacteraceae bacterium]
MSKVKLMLASMLLVFAVGAIGAASASAQAEFKLGEREGKQLTTDEFAEEAHVKSNLKLEGEKEPTIECSKMQIDDGVVTNNSPEATIKSLHFDGCVDVSEKTCEVPTIETAALKDTLHEDGEKGDTDETFEPKSGTELAHFKLKGAECKEASELKIKGKFTSKKEDNEAPEDEHKLGIGVTSSSKELEYGDQLRFGGFSINFGWGMVINVFWFLFG